MRWTLIGLLTLGLVLHVACGEGQSDADAASAALARGLEAHNAGNLEEAEKDYHEVLVHDPTNKYAFYNLGVIEQSGGNAAAAETYYRSALETDPGLEVALYNLAVIRTEVDDLNGALDLYRRAVTADPSHAGAHLNLGLLLRQMGSTAEGDAEISQAIALDPSLASRVPSDQSVTPQPVTPELIPEAIESPVP